MTDDALVPAAFAQIVRHLLAAAVSQPAVAGLVDGQVAVCGADGAPGGAFVRVILWRIETDRNWRPPSRPGGQSRPAANPRLVFRLEIDGPGPFDRELLAGAVIDAVTNSPVLDPIVADALERAQPPRLGAAFVSAGIAGRLSGVRMSLMADGGSQEDTSRFVSMIEVSGLLAPGSAGEPPVSQR